MLNKQKVSSHEQLLEFGLSGSWSIGKTSKIVKSSEENKLFSLRPFRNKIKNRHDLIKILTTNKLAYNKGNTMQR